MRTPALLLAGFAALATQASARSDTDYPHRDWGKVVTLDMSVTDATACITREMNRNGDATVIPVDGGSDIDVAPHLMWGPKAEPWQTFKVRDEAGSTTMRIFYRHPVKQGANDKAVAKMAKQCLKVREISPA
ncbi:hypothetical protein WBP06_09485 [Novosphingobium sp. BL-8H]|uniref:hypothetical protein n=1 Tax=Novosphingobium sp. BL-8H TaxID=3127640 RepID=UPI0037571B17